MPFTPSDLPYPVFVLCPPFYVSADIANNIWMQEANELIDRDKLMSQWFDFYQVLSANALVLLMPPKAGLQDLTYVNQFAYLPHLKDTPTAIISNFTAEGRAGEEQVAVEFLQQWGYKVFTCPYKFEGVPELKYLKDSIYFGGYGIRTKKKALDWIEQEFGAQIIKIREQDEYLYHLDCSVFVVNQDNIIAYIKDWPKKLIAEVEKVCTIHPVSENAAYMGVCNSLKVDNLIFNASSLKYMKKSDQWYKEEVQKNNELEAIADKLGLEIMYFDMSEATKSGALLSCFAAPLNAVDMLY